MIVGAVPGVLALAMRRGSLGGSMAPLGRGSVSVLVLLGVDASELLFPCWRDGMVGPKWRTHSC